MKELPVVHGARRALPTAGVRRPAKIRFARVRHISPARTLNSDQMSQRQFARRAKTLEKQGKSRVARLPLAFER